MNTYDHVYKVNVRVIVKDGVTDMRKGLGALTARINDTMKLRRLGSEARSLIAVLHIEGDPAHGGSAGR